MLLDHRKFLIKEHVGLFKLIGVYDIFDPDSGAKLAEAKEVIPGWVTAARFLINKRLLPTTIEITEVEGSGEALLTIHRGVGLFRTHVDVSLSGRKVGFFRSKVMSLGGGFLVFDAEGEQIADVSGNWKGWEFQFKTLEGQSLGQVNKKWSGLAKEMFTSADNYIVTIHEESNAAAALLLAAGLAIDAVYKTR